MVDHVLFLGTPSYFAVDASRLGGLSGGCAYFVCHGSQDLPSDKPGVFSYHLLSRRAKFFERLPRR